MKVKNADEIRDMIMNLPSDKRRIFSITAHIDHGKSTLSDYLLAKAGLMSAETAGEKRMTDSDDEEQERGITIFTTVVILSYDYVDNDGNKSTYIFQINDTPGHLSFTGEVSRALRGSDGAVLLVDALEGMMTQTETNIQLAVGEELCKPVLFINKVDRLISELKLAPKDVFAKLDIIAQQVNNKIKKIVPKELKSTWKISFADNSVAVGSAKDGWAFTVEILKMKNLNPQTVFEKYANDEKDWLRTNLPLQDAVLRMVVQHLPHPVQSHPYKIPNIWGGDINTEVGQSLIKADPNGPLLGMITKIFIDPRSKRPTLIGRVFSGTLKGEDDIWLINRRQKVKAKRLGVMEITDILPVPEIPAGNLFAAQGFICPAGESFTRVESKDVPPFDKISYAAEPVVSRAVFPKKQTDVAKLGEVVNTWIMADPTATYSMDAETKKYTIEGIDPLQIDILISRINEQVPIDVSDPVIVHRETISSTSETFTTKSPNGHNRLQLVIHPMPPSLTKILKEGRDLTMMERKERAVLLANAAEGKWDEKFFRGYWAHQDSNILIENTKGVQRLERIQEFMINQWKQFCRKATLTGEPLINVVFEITDVTVHVDPAHTGITEVIAMVGAATNLCFLTAKPKLLEPMLTIDIKTPQDYLGAITGLLNQHRSIIQEIGESSGQSTIKATLPTTETTDLADEIRGATAGRGFFGYQFSHFQEVPPHLIR
jgi:elongation factor 2